MGKEQEEFRTFRGYSLADDQGRLTPGMEDYLEMIYRMTGGREHTRLFDLAAALNVQPPSATRMVQRLADAGLVHYERYGVIQLTSAGAQQGLSLLNRHDLIAEFLQMMGVKENVLKDTERIEHNISDELFRRISEFVAFGKKNPEWLQEWLQEQLSITREP